MLVYDGRSAPDADIPRTGGLPLVPEGFIWPSCSACGGNLQFLAHLPSGGDVLSVFCCQNDPGLCDEWSATSGANRVYVFGGSLRPATVPEDGVVLLPVATALRREVAPAATDAPVLGCIDGEPAWIQNDETPDCPSCASRMTFAASLEEGYDFATAANFGGGGRGYIFRCRPCRQAAFLWQC